MDALVDKIRKGDKVSEIKDEIILRGLKENNLKNVDLNIPKEKINVFTGLSGSGKSSVVFDTLATESRRRHTRWPRDWSSDVCSSDLQ